MIHTDQEGTRIYAGDLVLANRTIKAVNQWGRDVPYGTIGVYCGSNDNKTASVAWVGIGARLHTPFDKIVLYEAKSVERPDTPDTESD